jgi:hypothetical protein
MSRVTAASMKAASSELKKTYVVCGAGVAQKDDVAAGFAAAGAFAFAVSTAALAGSIAAPITPVALIKALRDTSVMTRSPAHVALDLAAVHAPLDPLAPFRNTVLVLFAVLKS